MDSVRGLTVEIRTQDGIADPYLAHPESPGPHPGVLVYPSAFGLRGASKATADRLASEGYAALVPNVFYRSGRARRGHAGGRCRAHPR